MLIVQYPRQFSGRPRHISNPCSASLLFPSKHYQIRPRVPYLLYGIEDPDIEHRSTKTFLHDFLAILKHTLQNC